ncbi:unnamed protein product [Blepharisma stoltei]|uniref:Uncharacterized protein n=1 Tax=Blepharisma stoltei TaxID=1481888 RepID=A0AAU9J8I1_9CILI|nr:unnamed protein product [Blepharisma stoltei]
MSIWEFFVWIGALKIAYQLITWVYSSYICKIDVDQYRYGWVAITGASDGIGKGLALEFSQRGFKVLLISRNAEKLAAVVKEIFEITKNPDLKYLAVDFKYSHRDPENFYKQVIADLSSYNISILINNVGFGGHPQFLVNQDLSEIEELIGVNVYPQTMLSYYLIPGFLRRYEETHQRSLIMSFSSSVEETVLPSLAVYSSVKKFDHFLSEAIRYEYSHAIDVATVKPGLVISNMSKTSGLSGSPLALTVETYAKSLINNLHAGVNYGHWSHSVQSYFFWRIPYQIMSTLLHLLLPLLVKLRIIRVNY